jgi:hypothetical protein
MGELSEINVGDGPPKFVAVNVAAGAETTVLAAVTGKKIRVLSYVVGLDATGSFLFNSDTAGTALTGVVPVVIDTSVSSGFNPMGHFETVSGELLSIVTVGGAADGHITYVEVD